MFLRKLNRREIITLRDAWGTLSEESIAPSTTNNPNSIPLAAPTDKPYYEYSLGIGNIFKVFRIDFNFRGNYKDSELYPDARKFGITGSFGFYF